LETLIFRVEDIEVEKSSAMHANAQLSERLRESEARCKAELSESFT
jgi:hypothetical protein